jgi:hypothetical protein
MFAELIDESEASMVYGATCVLRGIQNVTIDKAPDANYKP